MTKTGCGGSDAFLQLFGSSSAIVGITPLGSKQKMGGGPNNCQNRYTTSRSFPKTPTSVAPVRTPQKRLNHILWAHQSPQGGGGIFGVGGIRGTFLRVYSSSACAIPVHLCFGWCPFPTLAHLAHNLGTTQINFASGMATSGPRVMLPLIISKNGEIRKDDADMPTPPSPRHARVVNAQARRSPSNK